jgi:predicted RNA-binding protein with TRAM domain
MTDGAGQSLTLTSPSTFSTYTLAPGETEDIQATYTIEQSAADTGSISNTVSVDGTAPDGTMISDDIDASVVVLIDLNPSIEVIKVAAVTDEGDGIIGVGDIIQYTITVENTGNVTLSDLSLTDTLTALNGDPLILTTPLTFVSNEGSPQGTLGISEVATYSVTYVVEQSAVDAGGVFNTATAACFSADGTVVTDVSDNATPTGDEDGDGDPNNDPTLVLTTFYPAMELNMTVESVSDNGDGITGVGDIITYSISIANTGNITLSNIYQTYTLTDFNDTALMLTTDPVFAGSSKGSSGGTLLPGEIANYIATYIIDESAADSGGISNRINAISSTPSSIDNVSDELDTPVVVLTSSLLTIDLTKYATIADTNGDGSTGLGDTITYTLVATNTGNDELSSVTITDVLSDLAGNALTLTMQPTFISSSSGSPQGSLQIGEQATYRATFIVNNQAMNAGGVSNTAAVSAINTSGTTLSNISDDPSTTMYNDPTVTTLTSQPIIDNENILLNGNVYITKSNGLIIKSGDECYRIKVNNGNVVAEPVNCE